MKQIGKCLVGDHVRLYNYTSEWYTVRIHPTTYYRRDDQFEKGFNNIRGLYAELDMGQYILIRFSEKDDLTEFHRLHHSYI